MSDYTREFIKAFVVPITVVILVWIVFIAVVVLGIVALSLAVELLAGGGICP